MTWEIPISLVLGEGLCPLPIRIAPGLNGPLWDWSPRMSLSAARKLVDHGVREHAQRNIRLPPKRREKGVPGAAA